MKLLFAHDHIFYKFNDQFYSSGGLSEEVLKRYTKVFEKVTVLSRQIEIEEMREGLTLASTSNVEFVKVPNFKSIKEYYKIFIAKKIIHKELSKCDKVIVRLPSSIGNLVLNKANRLFKPTMIEVVACPWDSLWNHSYLGKLLAPVEYMSMRKKVVKAEFVSYVTNNFLQKRYPTKGQSISCSNVSLPVVNNSVLKNRIQKIKNMDNLSSEEIIKIGTIGAVNVKHKGHEYVLKTIKYLKDIGYENIEYEIIGGGDNQRLKTIAIGYGVENNVRFIGNLKHDMIFNWLEQLDLYIQPSKQEGLPRAVIEAMSQGVPSLGSNVAGIPELIDNEYLFDSKKMNSHEIANKILLILNKTNMEKQANRNFIKAKSYEKKLIENRRNAFLINFKGN